MSNIISITPLIEKRRRKEKLQKAQTILNSLNKVEIKDYSQLTLGQLLNHVHALENRHRFDLNFLKLLDCFMEEKYPNYNEEFEKFLEEIEG